MRKVGAFTLYEDPNFHRVKIGEFTMYRFDEESLWIEKDDGEGGQFKESALAEVINKFYKENF